MADIFKTVGDGHAIPDYATLTLWNAAEGDVDPDVGFTSIAECSGFCGAGANINGAFVRGAIIRGDVIWDGTNGASLADAERLTISSSSGIDVTDLRIFTNNQYISAMNYNADFIDMDRVIFDNTTAGLSALDINGDFPNGNIRNFVARGGADAVMTGFNGGTNLTNGIVYGAVDKGVEGGGSAPMVLTNILAFNNGGQDIDSTGGFTVVDCATEDSTGTYTGYTSAELVDFAGGNLQTKSTSDLATLGTGGSYIGVFLEESNSTPDELIFSSSTLHPASDIIALKLIDKLVFSGVVTQPTADSILLKNITELLISDSVARPLSDQVALRNITQLIFNDSLIQPLSDVIVVDKQGILLFSDTTAQPTSDSLALESIAQLVFANSLIQPDSGSMVIANVAELSLSDSTMQPTSNIVAIENSGLLFFSGSIIQPTSDTLAIELYTNLEFTGSLVQIQSQELHVTTQIMPSFGNNDLMLIDNTISYSLTDNTNDYRIK